MFTRQDWSVKGETVQKFLDDCWRATRCSRSFERFRRLNGIRGVTENKTDSSARARWLNLCRTQPELLAHIDTICENDRLGSPRLIQVENSDKHISPATACFAADYASLVWSFGSLDGLNIAEIGAGYGGLAALITGLSKVASYTIYDQPEVIGLQRRYLTALGRGPIHFLSSLEEKDRPYDLVISCAAFSELTEPLQEKYIRYLLKPSSRGWINWAPPHAPHRMAAWGPQGAYEWLSIEMNPSPVYWAWTIDYYRELAGDPALWTYGWGGCFPLLSKQLWSEPVA